MAAFKPIEVFKYPQPGQQISEDNIYWKKFGFPLAFKEYGGIDYIDFNPQEPSTVAVTCSSKVQLYSLLNSAPLSAFTRFKKTAYGGNFRKDGKLLVAGSDDGFLRLFQVETNRLLRTFKGHKSATHRCHFTVDGVHLVSFSDDKSVVLWDIPTEKKIKCFDEHTDYVRAGALSHVSQDLFISGSYDHTVKLYDARAGSSVLSVDHGVPVESVLMFPTGGLFISAGGKDIKIWDPVAGKLFTEVSHHHKTVTSLTFANEGRRLLSASLDRHVKIYDVTTYEVVHTLNYPSPILSVAMSPLEDNAIAVGMTDGLFTLKQKRQQEKEEKPTRTKKYHHGMNFKPTGNELIIHAPEKKIYKKYEKHLKRFESSLALDTVLAPKLQKEHPEITISVIRELLTRGSLKAAMAGRQGESLTLLMKFVARYISDIRFQSLLIDVSIMLMEIYGPNLEDPEIKACFQNLLDEMDNQAEYLKKLVEVDGIIQSILIATSRTDTIREVKLAR